MQALNSQRKAFLDMVAWSEGTDNGRQPTRNHGYDVIVGGELFTDYSDHPRKLVTLNPKLKSTAAGRYQLLSRWWDSYRKQLGLKDFSPKSQDAVALQQIKERKYPDSIIAYTGDILLVGINYDKESKEHQCLIERYQKRG